MCVDADGRERAPAYGYHNDKAGERDPPTLTRAARIALHFRLMSTHPDQSSLMPNRLVTCGRALVAAFARANRATHRALSVLLLLLLAAYFTFCALFLGLRYVVLPNIDHYKPDVSRLASALMNRPVTINGIRADWRGLHPWLQLTDVVIHDDRGERALQLPQVNATVSWLTVFGQLRLSSLELLSPYLEVERDANGHLYVAGIRIDADQPDEGRGLDWLLAQREIIIRNGTVQWNDRLRDASPLELNQISFVLRNQWRSHRLALRATPPAALAAPIDLRAEFFRPPFSTRRTDYGQWLGELYLDWRNTDLNGWKQYVDLPWELEGGRGAVRAWLNFNRGVIENVTADLDLKDVSVVLGEGLEPLEVREVSGRISAGETSSGLKQKLLSFGTQGHALTLTDFSLRTAQGTVLPRITASHQFLPASGTRPERHELKLSELDLEALAHLAVSLPLSAEERQLLDSFAPRGQLQNFSASWDGAVPTSGNYRFSGKFDRLALKEQPAVEGSAAVPGFDGLSGEIDASQDGGRVRLKGERSTLYLAQYLNESTLFFDELALTGSWAFRNNRKQLAVKVADMAFLQSGLRGRADATHVLPWPLVPGKLGEIDLKAHFPTVRLDRIVAYVPSAAGAGTRDWMSNGLIDGQANDVNLIIRGELDKFPFLPTAGSAAPTGVFRVSAQVARGKLSPAPHELNADRRTPAWPRIEDIEGRVTIDRTRLHVHADSARTLGVPLSAVDVVIPDFYAEHPVLDITGGATGQVQPMLNYVNATPIAGWIDNFTDETRASGNAKLALKIQLPLTDAGQPAVQGSVRFNGNDVQLWRTLPLVSQVNGELGFSSQGFQLSGLHGNFMGGPAIISGGTQRDGSTLVKIDGSVTADGIARSAPSPEAKRLARKLSGVARYAANIKVRNQRMEFSLDSSLAGLAMDLPAPLQKVAGETLPLRLAIVPAPAPDSAAESEDIRISLGRSISARYLRQRAAGKEAPWRVLRGAIGVNAAPLLPESGLSLTLSLSSLNLDAWRHLVSDVGSDSSAGADGGAAVPVMAYLLPDVISMRAGELTFADRTIENASVGISRNRSGWHFSVNADEIVGRVSWEDPLSEQGAGKLSARLSKLKIEESTASDVTEILSGRKAEFTALPGLDIVVDNFDLRGMHLGRLELGATNATLSNGPGREWRISRLAIFNPGGSMYATGQWIAGPTGGQTTLNYELDITDAGKLLDRMGFERTLKGGKGKMEGELNWRADPVTFDFPSMSGKLSLKLGAGQFLKADPGVAKLLGVMSLQSLPRRLTLDFRDVFSEGFAFDSIASTATIARGVLTSDSFKMRGPQALVLMDGTVDLAQETQNLSVVVIPDLNAGGASVLYGLAVNPVVGLGAFLAQYVLKNPLSAALTQEYQVTGPWKDPVIKKVASRRKPPADVDGGSTQ